LQLNRQNGVIRLRHHPLAPSPPLNRINPPQTLNAKPEGQNPVFFRLFYFVLLFVLVRRCFDPSFLFLDFGAVGEQFLGDIRIVRIRPATNDDLDIIVALNAFVQSQHAEALPDLFKPPIDTGQTVDAFRAILENSASVVLMAEDEEPIGCLYAEIQNRPASWVRLESQVFYIQHMVVSPKHRRRGVGTALLSSALSMARSRGIKRIELDVWSFNSEARRFWSKQGFEALREKMQRYVD